VVSFLHSSSSCFQPRSHPSDINIAFTKSTGACTGTGGGCSIASHKNTWLCQSQIERPSSILSSSLNANANTNENEKKVEKDDDVKDQVEDVNVDVYENEILLSELNKLTSEFEVVQRTIFENAKLYNDQLDQYESKRIELIQQNETQEKEIQSKNTEMEELKLLLNTQQNEATTLSKEVTEMKSQMKLLEKETKFKSEDIKRIQNENEKLVKENEKLINENEKIQKEMQLIQRKNENLANENETIVNKEKENTSNQIKIMTKKYETLNQEKESILEDQKEIEKQFEISQSVIQLKEDKLKSLQEKLDHINQTNKENVAKDIVGIKSKSLQDIHVLERQLEKSKLQSKRVIDELHERIDAYEEERKSLRKLSRLGLKRVGTIWKKRPNE